jgi:pyruvate/2-oxoglutarate dehydrogenase complex dihydrolipoamide dehydrogenase (E3) component
MPPRAASRPSYTVDLADVDRAILDGERRTGRVVVRRGSDRILGATIVARHAGEMIGEIGVAMAGRVGLAKLSAVIHPYPTQAEAIRRAADAYQRARLTPRLKRYFERWFAFARRG